MEFLYADSDADAEDDLWQLKGLMSGRIMWRIQA